jgi:hypothetical protein
MVTASVIVVIVAVLLSLAAIFVQKRTGPAQATKGTYSVLVLKGRPKKKATTSGASELPSHFSDVSFAKKPSHIGMR